MAKQTGAPVDAMERLWALWSGFHDGAEYASRHPAANPYLDADRVVTTAAVACERRHASAQLDRTIVHPAYTYGWMAGYLAAQRELAGAGDETSCASASEAMQTPPETVGARRQNIVSLPAGAAAASWQVNPPVVLTRRR